MLSRAHATQRWALERHAKFERALGAGDDAVAEREREAVATLRKAADDLLWMGTQCV
jgi:hypothetical protein